MATDTYAVRYRNFQGTITTRHVDATCPEQAGKKVKSKGRFVVSVRKVRPEDIIGTVATKKLVAEVVGKMPMKNAGILQEDTTLDSIIFKQKFDVGPAINNKKEVAEEPLWYKKKKREV